jgi:hypothetical protein
MQDNANATLADIQDMTLELIRSVVNEGLFELGELSGDNGVFIAWDSHLDEALERIRDVYVKNFDDANVWPWFCWLNLTPKGERVARDIEAKRTRS